MRLTHPVAIAAVGLVVAGIAVATAQEEAERKPVGGLAFLDEVEVTVVNIDVFVRDKSRQAVTDLTIDDFEVLQDGVHRELTNFLFIDESLRPLEGAIAPPSLAPGGSESDPAGPVAEPTGAQAEIKPIHIVVYIDNENLRPFDRNRVLGHLRRFLQATVRPGVEAMIVSYQGSLKIVQNFSSDPRELAEALRDLRTRTGARLSRDSEHSSLAGEIDRLRAEDGIVNEASPLSQEAMLVYDRLKTYADSVAMDTARDLMTIDHLSTTLTGLPGRKYLVYVSSGLPMVPGKDLFFELSQLYTGVNYNSLLTRFTLMRNYRSLAASANAQGVTFYTINAEGVAFDAGIGSDRAVSGDPTAGMIGEMNSKEPLLYLAERTGGLAVVGTNDFAGSLETIRQDLFTYYSIGYPITAAGGDRVHRIEVLLPKHPGLKLRYRRAFVEKSRQSQVQDTVMSALLFDIDDNPMGVEATVDAAKPAHEGRWLLPLRVAFPTESVALLPQGERLTGKVEVFVSLRGVDGKQADLLRHEQPIDIPRTEYEGRAQRDISVDLQLLVEPGRYRVAVGLFDPLTRQASYQVLSASTPGN
jgi:VWFA-related protein